MQHKHLLAAAIAAVLLASCSDDKPVEKKSEPVKLAAVSAEQMADEAEARYKKNSEALDGEYRREGSGAVSTGNLTLPADNGEPVTLTITDTITYDQSLRDQGIIARVETRFAPQEAFAQAIKAFVPWRPADDNLIPVMANHLQMRNDLLADDNVHSTFGFTPFQTQKDGSSIDFKGGQYEQRYNEKTPDISDYRLTIEPLTITDSGKDGKGSTTTFTAIKGDWGNKADGSAYLNIEPIKIENTSGVGLGSLEIEGIKGSGSGIAFDKALGAYLGKGGINIANIRYTQNGQTTKLGDINLDIDNNKTAGGNYNSAFGLTLKLDGASLQRNIPQLPVAPQNLRLNVSVSDISARANASLSEAMQLISAQTQPGSTDIPPAAKDKFDLALADLIRDKTRFNAELSVETDSGNAGMTAAFGIRNDSSVAPETWQSALNDANPATLQNLLKENLDLNIDAHISKNLADKTGLTPLIESRGAMFITRADDEYRVKLENNNGKITLNGMPMPF